MSEPTIKGPEAHIDTITGALLYMMTAYQRTQCPCLAAAIARHLESLASHPATEPVVRQVCARLRVEWEATAHAAVGTSQRHLQH